MTKELKAQWSEIADDFLKMYNAGQLTSLPMDVRALMWRMASAMQEAICADNLTKKRAHQTRVDNAYWRTR